MKFREMAARKDDLEPETGRDLCIVRKTRHLFRKIF